MTANNSNDDNPTTIEFIGDYILKIWLDENNLYNRRNNKPAVVLETPNGNVITKGYYLHGIPKDGVYNFNYRLDGSIRLTMSKNNDGGDTIICYNKDGSIHSTDIVDRWCQPVDVFNNAMLYFK